MKEIKPAVYNTPRNPLRLNKSRGHLVNTELFFMAKVLSAFERLNHLSHKVHRWSVQSLFLGWQPLPEITQLYRKPAIIHNRHQSVSH